MQKRDIDLKEIFKYPLSSFPWALASSVIALKKTKKSALLHELENKVDPVKTLQSDYASILAGIVQVIKV